MSITTLWRRKGQHHAGTLRAQLAATQTKLTAAQEQLDTATEHAKAQSVYITELEAGDLALKRVVKELSAQLNNVERERDAIRDSYDELAARYADIDQALRDLRATLTPSKVPPRPACDPDATAENVMPLWNATGLPTFAAAAGGQAA